MAQVVVELVETAIRQSGVVSVSRGMSEFGASVGRQEGLPADRLVKLAAGLARCADKDLLEEAEKCQVKSYEATATNW